MKKILFITGRLGGGGSERVLTLVANQLLVNGYEVSIIAFGEMDVPYENKCPVTFLEYSNDFNQIFNLRREIKRINPETVVAFEYYVGMKSVIATRGLKMKVVVSERNDPHKLDSQFFKRMLRNYLYSHADVMVFQTKDAKQYFSKIIQKKSVIICNPVKNNLPKWNKKTRQNIVLNFCKLEKQKNIPMLLEAFEIVHKEHPNYVLNIYGEGTEKDYVERIIREKNLCEFIQIFPFVRNIHEIASNCAMFVSSSDFEGVSNSMMEALAIGMPVICTDCPVGGARMLIKHGENGLLVPVSDSVAMASAINQLIENPEQAAVMALEAYKVREKYSIDNIIKQWENIV